MSIGSKLKIMAALVSATIFAIVRGVRYISFGSLQTPRKHLYDKMLKAVLNTVVCFFDGRIRNRFSKDIAIMADFLPRHLATCSVSISYPWLILGIIPYVLLTVYAGTDPKNSVHPADPQGISV